MFAYFSRCVYIRNSTRDKYLILSSVSGLARASGSRSSWCCGRSCARRPSARRWISSLGRRSRRRRRRTRRSTVINHDLSFTKWLPWGVWDPPPKEKRAFGGSNQTIQFSLCEKKSSTKIHLTFGMISDGGKTINRQKSETQHANFGLATQMQGTFPHPLRAR